MSYPTNIEGSKKTILKTSPGIFGSVHTLEHHTAGIEPAGSGAREVNEYWARITTGKSGSTYGQRFKTLAEASADFDAMTTPIIEVAK